MLDLEQIARFRDLNSPVSSSDLLLFSQNLLATPNLGEGEGSGEFLAKNNMFLGEPIFAYWKKEFTAILEHLGSKPTFDAQLKACVDQMVREIEWRNVHTLLISRDVKATPALVKSMLSGVEWVADDGSSYDYILDTRKWVSKLTQCALEALGTDIYQINRTARGRLQRYETLHAGLLVKKLQQFETEFSPKFEPRVPALLKQYQSQLDDVRTAIADTELPDAGGHGLARLDQQWERLLDANEKQSNALAVA